ncbi:MAG: NAD(P)/FAD-dependent oxidoreductase [Myxococcota bacterium]
MGFDVKCIASNPMNLQNDAIPEKTERRRRIKETMNHLDVLIIGSGISGISMGCHLIKAHPDLRFTILEARQDIGGTWDLFRYPGIRSDSDMYTFGFNFRPWTNPQSIAPGPEIKEYLSETVQAFDLRSKIRFGHRVTKLAWFSKKQIWVASVETKEGPREITARFVVTCTGYYNYASGYRPTLNGVSSFEGLVVHPQHWPDELDYRGKKIVVIGSGATAVTLVPALAKSAEHVTMLQRSPSYIYSLPAVDRVATWMKRWLPSRLAYFLIRTRNIFLMWYSYRWAQRYPAQARKFLKAQAEAAVGSGVDVDVHFNPRYDPWDQRVCVIPDDDLFVALRSGRASVATDTIDRIEKDRILLTSGAQLDADIIVTATGLELQFLGGARLEIDGRPVAPTELVTYRGMMAAGIPNWVYVVGYSAASWTLGADLASRYVCRLLAHMKTHGYITVRPPEFDKNQQTESLMTKLASAGYVMRGGDRLPRQGLETPWRRHDNYLRDYFEAKWRKIDDGVLEFDS